VERDASAIKIAVARISGAEEAEQALRFGVVRRVLLQALGDERREAHRLALAAQRGQGRKLLEVAMDELSHHHVQLRFDEAVLRPPLALRCRCRHGRILAAGAVPGSIPASARFSTSRV
jgi:hypothetical protein